MSGGSSSDSGNVLPGTATLGTGITVLPNTGGNTLVQVISIAVIVVGAMVLVSSIARIIAKSAYKA